MSSSKHALENFELPTDVTDLLDFVGPENCELCFQKGSIYPNRRNILLDLMAFNSFFSCFKDGLR